MSFSAELAIGSVKFRLLHCSYRLKREVDATGRPSSGNRGGTITFEVESTDDATLWEWMVDPFKTQDGTITFKKRDQNQKMKEVQWTKGYIVDIHENFDTTGENPMTIKFTVSAETLKVGSAKHTNPWPKS
jgi:hypothetical protein